jgi:hypothetical protein
MDLCDEGFSRCLRDANGRRYIFEAQAFADGANICTNWLKNKSNPVSSCGIYAAEIYVEIEIKRIRKIDLIRIPDTAALIPHFGGESITITPVLFGRTIKNILRKRKFRIENNDKERKKIIQQLHYSTPL